MSNSSSLLFLHAQTSIHPGSGSSVGVVDLPVMRERHTGWPIIPASSLKGVLRDKARENARANHGNSRKKANEEDGFVLAGFGPGKVDESSGHAGALTFTDARILLYPVRSMKGIFAWVTCPGVLQRFNRDLKIADCQEIPLPHIVSANKASVTSDKSPLLVTDPTAATKNQKLVLEEYDFTAESFCQELANIIADAVFGDEYSKTKCKSSLVILNDDDFTHFVKNATEISARIALDYEKKTVKEGALFYQEFLPAETVFYSAVLSSDSKYKDFLKTSTELLGELKTLIDNKILQIGGDETTGKGLCRAKFN